MCWACDREDNETLKKLMDYYHVDENTARKLYVRAMSGLFPISHIVYK